MTLPQLQRLCRIWQRRLRLQDWKITLTLVEGLEVEGIGAAYGAATWDTDEWTSNIELRAGLDDTLTESTLIHELIHVRLSELFPDSEIEDPKLERTINLLADCFLQAYPKRRRPDRLPTNPAP